MRRFESSLSNEAIAWPLREAEVVASVPERTVAPSRELAAVAVCIAGDERGAGADTAHCVAGQFYRGRVEIVTAPGHANAGALRHVLRAALTRDVACLAILEAGTSVAGGWLEAMLAAQEEFDADVVVGQVKAVFQQAPRRWLRAAQFHDRLGCDPGPVADIPGANNLLIRASTLRAALACVCAWGADGAESEDALLYALRKSAAVIAYTNATTAHEHVPSPRMDESWLVQRAYRRGRCGALEDFAGGAGPVPRTAWSRSWLVAAACAVAGAALFESRMRVATRLLLARHLGRLQALREMASRRQAPLGASSAAQ